MLSPSVVLSAAALHERDFKHSGHKTKINYRYSCVVSAVQTRDLDKANKQNVRDK